MSVYCSTYVWKTAEEHGTPLLVLLALAEYANDDGECWPGIPALAKKCRITERNAQLILRKLEADETITVVPHDGKQGNGGKTNRYVINGFVEWNQQADKIHVSKRKVVKTSAQGGENQCSKVVKKDSPDPSVTVKEPSIIAPDGAASANGKPVEPLPPAKPKPSKTPKPKAERKRDPVFDAVGEHIYKAVPGSELAAKLGGWIGKTTAGLKDLCPGITAQNVIDFVAWDKWPTANTEKVWLHFAAWLKTSVNAPPVETKPENVPPEVAMFAEIYGKGI